MIPKYELKDNNPLVNYIKSERMNILDFISTKIINISINRLSESNSHNNNINKYIKNKFVDTKNLINDMTNLTSMYEVKWNNNFIIFNTSNEIDILKRIKVMIYIIDYLKQKTKNKILLKNDPATNSFPNGPDSLIP